MEKILNEEYDCDNIRPQIDVTLKDLGVSASLKMTKVNLKKDPILEKFNTMFHVKGTPV